jgi:hypothetical protein
MVGLEGEMKERKLPKKLWEQSNRKWNGKRGAIIRTAEKEEFFNKSRNVGFKKLIILDGCGYCFENYEKMLRKNERGGFDCPRCSLKIKNICRLEGIYCSSTPFSKYVREMVKDEPRFCLALRWAKQVGDAIAEDGKRWGYIK